MARARFAATVFAAGAAAAVLILPAGPAAASSPAYCDQQARAYANQVAPGEEVIGGAIAGGVVGAIIGGATRGSRGVGPGALIGGGVGTVAGAASHSNKWHAAYNAAYNRCMGGRASYAAPPPGSDAWYDACARKYRSFRYSDGTYQPYGGGPRMPCQLP